MPSVARAVPLFMIVIWLLAALSLTGVYLYQASESRVVRVATTTSLYATGLLDLLSQEFQARYPGFEVRFIAVGSGEALRRAAMGDADLVLVHAPSLEKRYLAEGVLSEGEIIAYNYFVLLGPLEDPADVRGVDVLEALRRIYVAGERGEAVFVSRGDNSGTHVRELILWRLTGLDPSGRPWYIEAGAGMAQTLLIAGERQAYTLSDIGTYLKFRERLPNMGVMVEGGELLMNIYSVYLVRVPGARLEPAQAFMEFLTSEEGQSLIGGYGVEEFGRPLFNPAHGDPDGRLRKAWERLSGL